MNSNKPKKLIAFTLIELLVVISIIAILTAIIFPVFARARESARISTCASNMRQISLSLIMYCQDNDDGFPVHVSNSGIETYDINDYAISSQLVWINSVFNYVKNRDVWFCPSASVTPLPLLVPNKFSNTNYFYNGHASGKAFSAIDFPSESVLFSESAHRFSSTGMRPSPGETCPPPSGAITSCPDALHPNSEWGTNHIIGKDANSRSSNIPYVDGHVKFQKLSYIMNHWKNF